MPHLVRSMPCSSAVKYFYLVVIVGLDPPDPSPLFRPTPTAASGEYCSQPELLDIAPSHFRPDSEHKTLFWQSQVPSLLAHMAMALMLFSSTSPYRHYYHYYHHQSLAPQRHH